MNAALLSSKNMCWCTPQDFFDKLNAEFGFVLDPAATDKTAKCSLYYTPETDGLSQSWDRGGAVFCNPPYGREIGKWVQKAFEEARGGVSDCFTYPSADRHSIFSRLHLRESGNPLRARAATVHGRRRERGYKTMTGINEVAKEIHENARAHGWWDEERGFPEVLALIHSEVSEALEEYRNGHGATEIYFSDSGKPEGIPTELADVIIRVLDYCGYAGIDIDAAISQKHEYNKSRPYRHGGKKC